MGSRSKPLDGLLVSHHLNLLPSGTPRWDPPAAAASLAAGFDVLGTRGDLQGDSGASIGAIDGPVAGPLALDGEPRNQSQRRSTAVGAKQPAPAPWDRLASCWLPCAKPLSRLVVARQWPLFQLHSTIG